ncbi:uncharacterized protein CcaverHIS019_0101950 [Cutaneotrichosporon cavernicola]|uniref:RING-type E3 ubiquitin transferase n=1 Tax=Cutaneotrichosporon cavernicola TaxID=279322 RepID=A0AA48I133_9TREE|nr:uncharacterized protein CcaverHIS019_0101950 [Cutaneotrichosporon cavernicola]BEI87477.1 hypothetical protein CcaverHIS019_0101950 [Cutaneotrichosporon cavernicola]BEI95248.1 hypothetical protein CcaverHIS631_0101970 [Cutaneotrichosporon cavernicola]BEJ03021.1 hypothetical protein CcaverHIS641_0101960 [Cutaneotrichosporon cavernicola]
MSRRKAFDTSLSGGNAKAPQRQSQVAPATTSANSHDYDHVHDDNHDHIIAPKPVKIGKTVAAPPDADSSVCFICAEQVTYWAVGTCNHHVCHVCAIRLRVFYKMIECAYCKTLCPSLLFAREQAAFPVGPLRKPSSEQRMERAQAEAEKPENKGKKWYQGLVLPGTLDLKEFEFKDEKLGVVFEDEEVMEQSLLLLRFNCPYPDCAHMSNGWQALEKHTLAEHGLVFCKLCTGQLSRFSHEQVLYPPHLLAIHDPSRLHRGQKPPRPRSDKERELVKSWDTPHPVCEFCHEAFFGPDELFKHMRERHEECFVCKGMGHRDVYFQNYAKLENHFSRDHFPCPFPICIEKKFQVFGSELDLRAHMMEEHGEQMSQRDRAQARHVHLEFSARPDAGSSRAGGRGFSLGTRDGPQAQQLSAPPMNAAQAAQQRRQIQTDKQEEGRRRKAFATGLTDGSGPATAPSPASNPASGRQSPSESASGFATPREEVDDVTAVRHAALLSRVSMLVGDSPTKLASFRSAVRQFKNNESSAKDMIDTLFYVLDQDREATGGVGREIANLFDSEGEKEKQQAILTAVNVFRVQQQEQFPALGGAPTGVGTNWAGVSSGRILSAKRATHTGRGSSNSSAVWARVEAAAAQPRATTGVNGRHVPGATTPQRLGPSNFPSLGEGSSSRSATHSTPWAGGGAGSSSKTPSALAGPQIRSVNLPSVSSGKKPTINRASFPSLPSSGKSRAEERAALFSKPTARDESIARIRGTAPTPPNASRWGSGSADEAANGVADLSVQDEAPKPSKKKGKQKQLLFSVSARP